MRRASLEVRWALTLGMYGLCLVGVYVHRHGDLSVGLAVATGSTLGVRAGTRPRPHRSRPRRPESPRLIWAGTAAAVPHEGSPRLQRVSTLPSGTITFLIADIEGSTRLVRDGPAYADLLGTKRRILRTAVGGHGSVEVDTIGDELFAVFEDPCHAIDAAIDAQQRLQEENWPAGSTSVSASGCTRAPPSSPTRVMWVST